MATTRVLVIDDEDIMREYVEEALVRAGYDVTALSSGKEALTRIKDDSFDVVVTDLKMSPVGGMEIVRAVRDDSPDTVVIVMTAYGTIETAVQALLNGASDYILKPFAPDELELAISSALEHGRLARENTYLRQEVNKNFDFDAMVGRGPAMSAVYETVRKVAASKATALIRGESGTGKELVARAIHFASDRKDKPFIKVNCAALSAGLLESELFGHEKGAFTGAHDRKIGRFELADGGTLLLDEISEIDAALQPKLLRALQEREFERVGGSRTIRVDVRIVATSNRDLEKSVAEGSFRADLFYRLNVIPIHLPPLRERKEDMPALIEHFAARFAAENGRRLQPVSGETMAALLAYHWPGNVRELQNAIERAVVLADGPALLPGHFAFLPGSTGVRVSDNPLDVVVSVGTTVDAMERALIDKTLAHCGDNRTRAAELLGISVRTLRNKLNEYRKEEV